MESINNKDLRKYVSNSYLNISDDPVITAQKLGNTVNQINLNYSESTFEQMALQMTDYFIKYETSSIFRGRVSDKLIQVNVSNSNHASSTPIGSCLNHVPKIQSGFNEETLVPDCSRLESCLFCENYALHINDVDIRKLLSLKYILEEIPKQDDFVFQIIYRIDEILRFISNSYDGSASTIQKIQNETRKGILDSFWSNHLDMLLELDVIS